ncbi:MAG: electron transfer flavoprotein subunit beta/FixA family protein [Chloroherpetonaceae bacterium]|nr:electron transfer flavoprotein subunit beta/FixA family protein [Chloroherpetonaceae bacterium]
MKIAVCINQVPDTASRITISPDGKGIEKQGINFVINPYDEYALEEGLKLKEKFGGTVTVFSIGDDSFQTNLRKAFALGADHAVLIKSEANDASSIAHVLSESIQKHFGGNPDTVLLGKESTDHNDAQVGPMLAELLNLPAVTVVVKIETDGTSAKIWREIEGGSEVVELTFPFLVTAQKGLNIPRVANMKGIMMAKNKPIESLSLGSHPAKSASIQLEKPAQKSAGKLFSTSAELVQALRNEAKVI